MNGDFIHTPSSLAWAELCGLTDRPSEVLRKEWEVDNCSLVGPAVSSPDERLLFSREKALLLTREKNGCAITCSIPVLARVRWFQIQLDDSGQILLSEHGGQSKTVHETLNDLVSWLKGEQVVA